MHAGTGILAVVASVCMTLALVLAWGSPVHLLSRVRAPAPRTADSHCDCDERRFNWEPVRVPGARAQTRPPAEADDAVRSSDGPQLQRDDGRIWRSRVVRGAGDRSHGFVALPFT